MTLAFMTASDFGAQAAPGIRANLQPCFHTTPSERTALAPLHYLMARSLRSGR
jgi:hypothetical protein